MRRTTLMTAAAALAIGLAGPAFAADTSDAPGGSGVNEAAAGEATTQKGENEMPASGAGSVQGGGDMADDEGGTGVKASADSEGATNKSTDDPDAATGMNEGDSTGNAPGGSGVEKSAEAEGAKNKTSTE